VNSNVRQHVVKFVRDSQGNLVPEEEWLLQAELERLKRDIENVEPSNRTAVVERMRWSLASRGHGLSAEDEDVLVAYCEGVLDYRHLVDHFGQWVRDIGVPGRS
jgi:hypothetical protein